LRSLIVRPRVPFRRHSTPVVTLTRCWCVDTTQLKMRSTLEVLPRGGLRLARVSLRIEEGSRSPKVRSRFSSSTNATTAAIYNGVVPILLRIAGHPLRRRYTHAMADDAVLEEIQENTKEAGLRLRASLSLLRSQGMLDDGDCRELVSCLRTSLAMVEAAYYHHYHHREQDV
jgi:hypothetical protein